MNVGDTTTTDTRSTRNVVAKPKLLQLTAVGYTAYHFVVPLARALRADYEVHFATSPGPYVERIRAEGFVCHEVTIRRNMNVVSHLGSLLELRRLMNREGYAVVHTHTPIASLIGRFAAHQVGVPVKLYTSHGFYFHERMKPMARRFYAMLEKWGGRFTDGLFTVSGEDRDAAIKMGLLPKERITFIGNGVDMNRFDPDVLRDAGQSFRHERGIKSDDLVICITGRLVREKGYLELVEAFRHVVQTIPNAVLLVVGGALESDPDDAAALIDRRIRTAGLVERVHRLPFTMEIERVLSASDLFVLPSYREGMPISILEAMAMGLPVVATRIRGSREIVVEGVTGMLVEVGDERGLADAITDLLDDSAKREAYGLAAKRLARERYDEVTVVKKQLDVIARLTAAHKTTTG